MNKPTLNGVIGPSGLLTLPRGWRRLLGGQLVVPTRFSRERVRLGDTLGVRVHDIFVAAVVLVATMARAVGSYTRPGCGGVAAASTAKIARMYGHQEVGARCLTLGWDAGRLLALGRRLVSPSTYPVPEQQGHPLRFGFIAR